MEGNKDEALRCLSIAQKHRNAGNYTSARKFIQKSLALFATPEAERLAGIIETEDSASTSTSTSRTTEEATRASGTEKHPSAGGTHHRHPNGNASKSGPAEGSSSGSEKKRDYTPDQLAVVKRVRTCRVTEYYEILALKKDCEEAEVKKAYRKVRSFVFWPCWDISLIGLIWNSSRWPYILIRMVPQVPTRLSRVCLSLILVHLGGLTCADWVVVSKAFQVLSDSNMRAAYDRHGADPESRFSGMSSSSARGAGFHPQSFGGNAFETEISPEELFNLFFGGGGGFGGPCE